uniref:Hexosyltransferase n=1 Tax=Parastrongyloides trichosuri TaxID=131310 RepID=A0A0N4Z5U6_PARTI
MPHHLASEFTSLSLHIKLPSQGSSCLDYPINDFRMGGSLVTKNNNDVKSCKIHVHSFKRTLQADKDNNQQQPEDNVNCVVEEDKPIDEEDKEKLQIVKKFLLHSPISFKLFILQFIWILPYLMLTNYLERSLLPFRFLCYTETDLLSVQKPYRQDFNQCIKQFFPNRQHNDLECNLNQPIDTLISPNLNEDLKNVIVIRSAPGSRDYRNYIRETWKKTNEPEIPIIFVAGRGNFNLIPESDKFGDILQLDFVDSYKNLSRKMMGIYDYFLKNSNIDQIIVINDDTIVNATALRKVVSKKYEYPVMTGKVSRGYPRLFFNWLPWYVSSEEYPNKCYPPFIQGSSFIINRPAAELIHKNICKFPFLHLDDVFMGIITNCLGIQNRHEEGFDHHILNKFVVFHYQYLRYSAPQLMNFWKKIEKDL